MEELDYHPNLMAGSLRSNKTNTIGLIIPDSSNPLFSDLSNNIENIFFSSNYNTIVCNSSFNVEKEIECINTLRTKMVDGLILMPVTFNSPHIEKLKTKIPIVTFDRITDVSVDVVLNDNKRGGYLAAEHLLKLGHQKIGYIDRYVDHSHSLDRKKGFIKALKDNGLEMPKDFIVRGEDFNYRDGRNAMRRLLDQKDRPTAVFAINDVIAIGAIRAIFDSGLRVPEDISIIGYDDIDICDHCMPRLTTIHYPKINVAKAICKQLLFRIEKSNKGKAKITMIEPRLIIRESTARPGKIKKVK